MNQTVSQPDFFKPYIDAGFTTLIWRNPRNPEDPFLNELGRRLEVEGLKVQILKAPEPPPNFPTPPYYPELTLTILKPSSADTILNIASQLLKEYYRDQNRIAVKVDVISDSRLISGEANGAPLKVVESIKNIPMISELASSNLAVIVMDRQRIQPTKVCHRCGGVIHVESRFCHICGEKQ
ncbi:MAG: hypothetical protein ACUVUB_04830 [Candidatus Bathyarchaeia archaeon]